MMFKQYTVQRKLGVGGYGSVYLCKDEVGARYAVKRLPKSKNIPERVYREIDVLKMMRNSPSIVRYVDDGEDDSNFYIVQEWCPGGCLYEKMLGGREYTEKELSNIVRSTLQALYHLHKKNVIHGDVKASNVFIHSALETKETGLDLEIKLGDFGNSWILGKDKDVCQVAYLIGTPEFMAPENLRHTYHRSSDIWGLGVMVYAMLSDTYPFSSQNPPPSVIYKNIFETEPKFRERIWLSVSEEAKDFIKLCLHKDYEKRPLTTQCLEHPWLKQESVSCNTQQ